jgi:hypothetical protein
MHYEESIDQWSDIILEFNIQIPCKLAERLETYASANNTIINSIVIEALDLFLREQKRMIC